MKSRFGVALLATTALSGALLVPGSAALAAAAGAAATAPDVMETVVVTAQKREQNVQDVPLAVEVIGGTQLAAAGVQDFADLGRVSPNLVIRSDVQPVNATVSIRGVGTNAFGIGVEPSVAVQVDDVPVAFQARAFADLADIERIEVLSGPQSTLYGKSASAGLINIVTGAPSRTTSVNVGALVTNDREHGFNAIVSGPLADNLGFRVSTNYDNFDGNVHNLYNGSMVNGSETFSTRAKLAWDPTTHLNVVLAADYIDGNTSVGRPFIAVSPNANLRGNTAYTPSVWGAGVSFGPDNLNVINNYPTTTTFLGSGQSLKVSWDLGAATLMSITSHAHYVMDDHQDSDESGIAAIDNRQTGDFINNQTTEELRLVSAAHQPIRYTLGLFYADVDYVRHFIRGPYFSVAHWDATEGSKQDSAFGQVEWDIVPKLTLIGGLRVGQEKINYTFLDYTVAAGLVNNWAGSNTDNYNTYKAGLQYHLTDDAMLFVTTSTGHKGPTYDLTTGFNAVRAAGGPVKPEESTDYEAGARLQFMDHRLTINPTIFDTQYRNFQAQGIQVLADGTTNFRLSNVGSLRSRGVEVDGRYRASKDLSLGLSVAYLDAIITTFPDAQCYPGQTPATGCVAAVGVVPSHQNLAGAHAPQAPEWKVNADLSYTRPIGSGPLVLLFKAAYTYQSEVNYTLTQDPQAHQPAYGILNLSAGYRDTAKNYEVTLFANNALDQRYYASLANSQSTYGNNQALQAIIPRDFKAYAGIRLTAHY